MKDEPVVKDQAKKGFGARVSMEFQLTCMIISLGLIFVIFSQALLRNPLEKRLSDVQEITPKEQDLINRDPLPLSVGFTIRDFPLFDMKDGSFIVDTSILFMFDPRLITVKRISDFQFQNSEILVKSDPFIKLIGSKLFVRYNVRIKFHFDLLYKRFPFEGHRLLFVLIHPHLTPEEITYVSNRQDFVINSITPIPGWDIVDHNVSVGFSERFVTMMPDEQEFLFRSPSAVFSIDFQRVGVRRIFTIFIPLLLLFLITLSTLSFAPSGPLATTGIGLSAAVISGLIGYRFVIERMSPKVGYLLLSDYIFLIFLVVSCVVFLVNVFSQNVTRKWKNILVVGLHSVVTGAIWYYFLFF